MQTNSTDLLKSARRDGVAIGAFSVSNLEFVNAVIGAAEASQKPVIVQTSPKALDYAGFSELTNLVRTCGQRSSVPIVLHLDHGKDLEFVLKAIEIGLHTSVMYDGSALPYEENLENTKKVVEAAHAKNISVEAELGGVGNTDNPTHERDFTNPEQAEKFVRKTGCDCLAVAFGNNHGVKSDSEKLDFDLLKLISENVETPLAFHGASNSSGEEFTQAIKFGMAKINIDTQLRQAFTQSLRDYLSNNPDEIDPRVYLSPASDAVTSTTRHLIELFSTDHKSS